MNYKGRQIDPISFWSKYVSFPNTKFGEEDVFSPKVQCPNPNHDTLKSHFQINLSEPLVHCFAGCGISGTYEHAVCVIEGLYEKFDVSGAPNDQEAKRRKARAIREAGRIILRNSSASTARHARAAKKSDYAHTARTVSKDELRYESFLPPIALEYLESRGISEESVALWELGWLPDEKRVVIPAKDQNGKLRFLIKRAVLESQNPKYLYTEGFPKTSLLFGLDKVTPGTIKSRGLILVEGSLDRIALHQHGFRNTAAILGTGISDRQVEIVASLRPPKIYLFFDRDSAGIQNIDIASVKLRKYPLYVVKYPKGKFDPAEMGRREAEEQIEKAIPVFRFLREAGLA